MAEKTTRDGSPSTETSNSDQDSTASTFADEKAIPESSESTSKSSPDPKACDTKLSGWRYWGTMSGLYLGVFLVTLDMTIVNTALIAISDDLHDFSRATWIINAYVLSWTCCMLLWAQFSHTMGRKPSLMVAVTCFTVFSVGCALAQTSVQLIILRAFQGLSGAGVVTIPAVLIPEVVRPTSIPKYIAFLSLVSAISFTVGPLIGGAIATNTTWRWVFWINLPIGVAILIVNLVSLPNGIPHHQKPKNDRPKVRLSSLKSLDLIGGAFYICASVPMVTAFQEAGSAFTWRSAFVICFLVISVLSWIGFVLWERHATLSLPQINPLITWKFCHRKPVAMFICSALIWIPFTTALIQIPLQYQIIQNMSPEAAGVRLLPFIILHPFGAALASLLTGKFKFNLTAGLLIGALIQAVAAIGFATLPPSAAEDGRVPHSQYAFQVLMGLGNGLSYSFNFNGIPQILSSQRPLVSPAMGVNSQLRYLGGALGLGIITAALNGSLKSRLPGGLMSVEGDATLNSISLIRTLDEVVQRQVRLAFACGFLLQWRIVCGVIGVQILACLFTV